MLKKLLIVLSIVIIIMPAVAACSINRENISSILDKIADNINDAGNEIKDAFDSITVKPEADGDDIIEDIDITDININETVDNINDIINETTAEELTVPEAVMTEAPTEPETDAPENLRSGFEVYDNQFLGIKIQYPVEWMYIDGGISAEEFDRMVLGVFGQQAADLFNELGADPSAITLIWYDFGNASEYFVPNANLGISDAEGITQNDFKSPFNIIDLQEAFDSYYPFIFDNFQSKGMTGQEIGGNYYAVYKFDCVIDYIVPLSCYQAMTEKNGLLYTLTFSTHGGKLDIDIYEKMLSSLEFY
ncbi:MAG: hypothetical protein FWF92_00105 [Oscillospiraceae bacterium]|nr:hypothetical protein [Oscillospiraceae bacterium]